MKPAQHFARLRELAEEYEPSHERSLAMLRIDEAELWLARCAAIQQEAASAARPERVRKEPQAPDSPVSPGALLTVEQAAAELQIARRRIFEMIADGTLPSVKIGKSRRITRTALEDYVKGLSG